jgi:hypothetical protein
MPGFGGGRLSFRLRLLTQEEWRGRRADKSKTRLPIFAQRAALFTPSNGRGADLGLEGEVNMSDIDAKLQRSHAELTQQVKADRIMLEEFLERQRQRIEARKKRLSLVDSVLLPLGRSEGSSVQSRLRGASSL